MPDIDSYCSSKYLRACDLDGKDAILTVAEVSQTEYEDGTTRPLIHWQEKGVKPLGCNQTNKNTLIGLYGRDTDAMKGKRVTLYPTTTEYKGNTTPCIRFRQSVPQEESADTPQTPAEPPATDVRELLTRCLPDEHVRDVDSYCADIDQADTVLQVNGFLSEAADDATVMLDDAQRIRMRADARCREIRSQRGERTNQGVPK